MGDVLHERESELAALGRAVTRLREGHGGVVLIEGSPGIGKTRLLDELCELAEPQARVLRARGGEQEREIPLLVTSELFTPYVVSAPGEELERVFAGAAALAGPLLGRGTAEGGTSDPGFVLVHGLYWLVANLADVRPLVLVVDDVQWVDEATQRWLAYLVPRVAELPVLLAMALRPRELEPGSPLGVGLAGARELVHVRPTALSPPAAAELLRMRLPGSDDAFCHAAYRAADGNPLLLHALASAVRERGGQPTASNAATLDKLGAVQLQRIILPRLHRLGPDALGVVRALSILGDVAELADVADLAGISRQRAGEVFDQLVDAEILRAEPRPAFTHPLVRASVHGEISPGSAASLHLSAARQLRGRDAEPELVARHLSAAGRVGEEWVIPALEEAAALAAGRGAPEAALAYLDAALREDMPSEDRFRLLLRAGWHAFRAWDARARPWLEEALRLAPDDASAVRAWAALWNWRTVVRDGNDPETVLDGLPERLPTELALVVQTHFLLDFGFSGAPTRRLLGRYPVPNDLADRSERAQLWLSARAADETVRGSSARRALALADRVDVDALLRSRAVDTPNLVWLVLSRAGAGDLAGSEALARAAADRSRRRGSRMPLEWMATSTAVAAMMRGDVSAAAASFAGHLDEGSLAPVPVTAPSVCGGLVWIHCERDDLPGAERVLAAYGLLTSDPPSTWHGAFLLHFRAYFRRASGDLAGAARDHRLCRDVLASFDAVDSPFTPWRAGLASCLAELGEVEGARELAGQQVERAESFGAAPLLGHALRTLAEVSGSEHGIDLAERAVAVLSESEATGELVRAQLALGRSLRLDRQPTRAREVLAPALDVADRLGASRLARQVEDELRLAGARPRRRAVTGVHALTPAELRVATLAAEGLSNPEVAQALFVTRKTVEKHLGSAFAKLHVSSRDQLPAVLRR